MSRIDKLLVRIRSNPSSVTYNQLRRVLVHHGVHIRPGRGSHRVACRGTDLYTIKDPGDASHLHPKTVKHCLQLFGLWSDADNERKDV